MKITTEMMRRMRPYGPAALLLLATSCGREYTDLLEQTVDVQPGGRLVVEADRGSIEVSSGQDDQLKVRVLRRVRGLRQSRAEETLKRHRVTYTQTAGQVTVRGRFEGQAPWPGIGGNLQAEYEITLPSQFDVDLKTAGGEIRVRDLTGEVKAHTSGGGIRVGRIDGSVDVRTSGGGIDIANATGSTKADTSGGGIRIGHAGAALDARTSGGSVGVETVRGSARLHTSGGSIRAENVHSTLHANTSGGSIRVGFAASPEEDCEIETFGGNVEVYLPEDASLRLDARARAGRVNCELPLTLENEATREAVAGFLGDGGPTVKVRTSAGSINIRPRR